MLHYFKLSQFEINYTQSKLNYKNTFFNGQQFNILTITYKTITVCAL